MGVRRLGKTLLLGKIKGFVAQIQPKVAFSFSGTDLSCGICDANAECSVAVEPVDANLDFRDLSVEVSDQEALAKKFDAVHLCLCAAPAAIPS